MEAPEEKRPYNCGDLGKEVLDELTQRITLYSTVLVRQVEDERIVQNGSGTFIRFNGESGVLTAGHVASRYKESCEDIHVAIDPRGPMLRIPFDYATIAVEYGMEGAVPDLGFIRIPGEFASKIETKWKAFYNLGNKREACLEVTADLQCGFWALSGAPVELTAPEPSPWDGAPADKFTCLVGFSGCEKLSVESGWDLLQTDVDYQSRVGRVPETTMAGYSGGGLWSVRFIERDGTLDPVAPVLAGVAFLESGREHDRNLIKCHGPRGILSFLDRVIA